MEKLSMPMPELITVTRAIVVDAIKLCLKVYGTIDSINEAPEHLKATSADLKAFYRTLGSLQFYLDKEELKQSMLHKQTYRYPRSILANCAAFLHDFDKIVSGHIEARREYIIARWPKVSRTWKHADIEIPRKQLSDYEASLSSIINNDLAKHESTSSTVTDPQEACEKSAEAEARWVDLHARVVAVAARVAEMTGLPPDRDITLQYQRVSARASSHKAEVSTKNASSRRSSSFSTASTWQDAATVAGNNATYPLQLLVRGVGSGTAVVRGSKDKPEFRYGHQLMVAVEKKICLPTTIFWLAYAGKVIREDTDMSFVPIDATVCAHYRITNGIIYEIIVEVPGGELITITNLDRTMKDPYSATEATVMDLESHLHRLTRIPDYAQRLFVAKEQVLLSPMLCESESIYQCPASSSRHTDTTSDEHQIQRTSWTLSTKKLLHRWFPRDAHASCPRGPTDDTRKHTSFGRILIDRVKTSWAQSTAKPLMPGYVELSDSSRTLTSYGLFEKGRVIMCDTGERQYTKTSVMDLIKAEQAARNRRSKRQASSLMRRIFHDSVHRNIHPDHP